MNSLFGVAPPLLFLCCGQSYVVGFRLRALRSEFLENLLTVGKRGNEKPSLCSPPLLCEILVLSRERTPGVDSMIIYIQ